MEKELRLRLILTLKESIDAINTDSPSNLKHLSDYVIHSATILQSQYPIEITVMLYSLAKIYERDRYQTFKDWNKFDEQTKAKLEEMISALEDNNEKKFQLTLKQFFQSINRLDQRLRHYIEEVIENAKTTKASRIYEHGISMGQTASILGVSQYDLMRYTGTTGIADASYSQSGDVEKRLVLTRSLFK